jgi:hypothetical protein
MLTLAMGDRARRRATYEDVLAAPPHQVAQVIEGQLHLRPRPAGPHALAAWTWDSHSNGGTGALGPASGCRMSGT